MAAANNAARAAASRPQRREPLPARRRQPQEEQRPRRAEPAPRRRPSIGKGNTQRARTADRKRTAQRTNRPVETAKTRIMGNQLAYLVLVPTVALLMLGLVMVFSAGSIYGLTTGGGYKIFVQQVIWAVIGVALMAVLSRIDYHKLAKVAWIGVVCSITLLVAVLVIGKVVGGARRWLVIGGFNLQPTEIAKFTLVVFAAYALAMKGEKLKKFVHLLVPVVLLLGLEGVLILAQPDLGSALVLCFSVMMVACLSSANLKHLAVIAAAGGAGALFLAIYEPYRRARLFSFINPWKSPQGYGYHVIQSYIALGTGHIKGLGLGMSRQKFLYLPNAHTDFIYAIIGEELGLIGTLSVITLVGLFAFGGFRVAHRAPDELGKLLAMGITGIIVIQAIVNMAGVTGLLPITGVPLPLVSAGGSSLCVCMACIGILLNVASQSARQR